jgi:hypothetical protein
MKKSKVIEFPKPFLHSSPGMEVEHVLVAVPRVRVRFPFRQALADALAGQEGGFNTDDVLSWVVGPLIEHRHNDESQPSAFLRFRAAEEAIRWEAAQDVAGEPRAELELEPWHWASVQELAGALDVPPVLVIRAAIAETIMKRSRKQALAQ